MNKMFHVKHWKRVKKLINHDIPQYTLYIRDVILAITDKIENTPITDELIQIASNTLFDFDYGLSVENKKVLEYNFMLKFMYREIATTPIERWKMSLKSVFIRNGKKWEKMLNIDKKEIEWYNPYNLKETTIYEANADEQTTANSSIKQEITENISDNSHSNTKNIGSDLPQTTLNGLDYATTSTTGEAHENAYNVKDNQSQSTNEVLNNVGRKTQSTNTLNKVGSVGNDISVLMNNYKDSLFSTIDECLNDCYSLFYSLY